MRVKVVIVGAGFSGLGMAIALKRAGMDDFVVLEKSDDLGGTWRDNQYPGCACDIPSNLYSYSFEQNPHWTRSYPSQPEIWDYLRHCADKYRITPHIRFGREFVGGEFDEASNTWRVQTGEGGTITCQALVLGLGALHRPAYPDLPGIDRFAGPAFHSARWDSAVDLAGKRVAVVGTGASAIQFVPEIAPRVARLSVFQRTPPWIIPRHDRPVSPLRRRLFGRVPLAQRAYRAWIYGLLETRALGFTVDPRLMAVAEFVARRHLRGQIVDPVLRRRLSPDYTMGCKRVLISDDYYPALQRPNVELVTDRITEVRPDRIVTGDGRERVVDAIVYGTGFHVTDAFDTVHLVGRNGRKIVDAWRDGPEAYYGITVADFPNAFLLLGPNTGLGHNSVVFMIEAQVRYIMECLRHLLAAERGRLEVRADAQAAYNRRLQERLRRSVWLSGCKSWYLDESGVNRAIWPGFSAEYWLRTRRPKVADYLPR